MELSVRQNHGLAFQISHRIFRNWLTKHTSMKAIVTLFLSFAIACVHAQDGAKPTYFLNSKVIEIENVYINPANIETVQVEKETTGGEIHITTKSDISFLTLESLMNDHSSIVGTNEQMVFMINDQVIKDKSEIKIDRSFYVDLKVKRFDEVTYIPENYRNLVLVEIQLLNEKPKPVIRLRGTDEM